jgi:hypothetical protein
VIHISEDRFTSIRVKQSTSNNLKEIGRKGESYDQIIVWLLEHSKKRKAGYQVKTEEN